LGEGPGASSTIENGRVILDDIGKYRLVCKRQALGKQRKGGREERKGA